MFFKRNIYILSIAYLLITAPTLKAAGGYFNSVQQCLYGMFHRASTHVQQSAATTAADFLTDVGTRVNLQHLPRNVQVHIEQTITNIADQQIPRIQKAIGTTLKSYIPKLCYSALSTSVGMLGAYTSYQGIMNFLAIKAAQQNTSGSLKKISLGLGLTAASIAAIHLLWNHQEETLTTF